MRLPWGGHSLANLVRGGGTGYIDILDDIVGEMKIKGVPRYNDQFKGRYVNELDMLATIPTDSKTIQQHKEKGYRTAPYTNDEKQFLRRTGDEYCALAEQKILQTLGEQLQAAYDKMSTEEKAAFEAEAKKIADKYGENWGVLKAAGGAFALANLSGFGVYMAMSSLLHALSFGALSFGAYTAASSLLHLLLGPVGWIALVGTAIHKAGKGNLKKTIPFALAVGGVRQRLLEERRAAAEALRRAVEAAEALRKKEEAARRVATEATWQKAGAVQEDQSSNFCPRALILMPGLFILGVLALIQAVGGTL